MGRLAFSVESARQHCCLPTKKRFLAGFFVASCCVGISPVEPFLIQSEGSLALYRATKRPLRTASNGDFAPRVWLEDAEDGFVDDEENLEPGEVCLKSVKAFAAGGGTERGDGGGKRFLCAGALVTRPPPGGGARGGVGFPVFPIAPSRSRNVCDVWTADSVLTEGGPNLQLRGAVQVLDGLLLFHLEREYGIGPSLVAGSPRMTEWGTGIDAAADPSIRALRNFVLHCGSGGDDDALTCASYMASQVRGFAPLRDLVRVDSIYSSHYYDHNLDGMVFDCKAGIKRYEEMQHTSETARKIYDLLPGAESLKRHTTKRFSLGG